MSTFLLVPVLVLFRILLLLRIAIIILYYGCSDQYPVVRFETINHDDDLLLLNDHTVSFG